MKKKILAISVIAISAAILLPAMAISQNQTKTFCQQLNDLRAQSLSDLVKTFQGNDSLSSATALLRETSTNPAVAARFDMALAALRDDPAHQALKGKIAQLQQNPRASHCQGIATTRFIAPGHFPDQ